MKILREVFELAKAAATDAELHQWLVGDQDAIADLIVIQACTRSEIAIFNRLAFGNNVPVVPPFMVPPACIATGK